jgi:orotate phosphoribosyltransferase
MARAAPGARSLTPASCYLRFSMSSARQELLRLLATKSFRLGEFKLSSGGTSDYYIDCRTTTLDARGSQLTGQVFLEEIRQRGWRPQAIGGLTMGADPVVVAVAVTSGDIHGFLVRKAEKQHGTGQRIEGFREKGARVVIVDDVCTTGASTVQAIEVAREFGFEIAGVMCLVEREEAKGRPNVEKAAAPAPFVSIFTAADVRSEHLQQKDETSLPIFAVAARCEMCGRPAVTNTPRNRCEVHRT